jgi:hypothetical protein
MASKDDQALQRHDHCRGCEKVQECDKPGQQLARLNTQRVQGVKYFSCHSLLVHVKERPPLDRKQVLFLYGETGLQY